MYGVNYLRLIGGLFADLLRIMALIFKRIKYGKIVNMINNASSKHR